MVGLTYTYKVVGPLGVVTPQALQAELDSWGQQGWELIDVEIKSNRLIFQQTIYPLGCTMAFTYVLTAFLNALGMRKR